MTLHVGMLLFPRLTQLDLTGPFELFTRLPDSEVHLVWKTTDPVRSDSGLQLVPTTTLGDCPPLDVLFIPGGAGQMDVMTDELVLDFVRRQGQGAKWVTSVCTGSFVLAAAGLLDGYRATSHWAFRDLLPRFGAELAPGRVVIDRNRITAGGVTAGIDFGLTMLATIAGDDAAKCAQLGLEYDPQPPFACGNPETADPHITKMVRAAFESRFLARQRQADAIVSG